MCFVSPETLPPVGNADKSTTFFVVVCVESQILVCLFEDTVYVLSSCIKRAQTPAIVQ